MNNKYTQYNNKNVSKVPKKAKNKPSYYLVMILLILTFFGSILGGIAFVQNNVASADTVTEIIDLSLRPNEIYNEYGAYDITSGVSARTLNENLKNFGVNGYNNSYEFGIDKLFNIPSLNFYSDYSNQEYYYFFITLNDFITVNSTDIINFDFNFDTVNKYDVYFLNSKDSTQNTNILYNIKSNNYNNSLSGFNSTFNIIRFVIYADSVNNYIFDNVFFNFGITIDKVEEEIYEPTIPSKPITSSEFENIIDLDYSNVNYSASNDIYEISTGVTTNTGNADIKNLGIKNYVSEDFNNFYLTSQYDNALYIDSNINYYDLFFTLNEPITINRNDCLQLKFVTMYKQNTISQFNVSYVYNGGFHLTTNVNDVDSSENGLYVVNWFADSTYTVTSLQVGLVFNNPDNIDNEVFSKYLMLNYAQYVEPDDPDVPVEPDEPDVPVEPDEPDVPVTPSDFQNNLGIFANINFRYKIYSDRNDYVQDFNFTYDNFINNYGSLENHDFNIVPWYGGFAFDFVFDNGTWDEDIINNFERGIIRGYLGSQGLDLTNYPILNVITYLSNSGTILYGEEFGFYFDFYFSDKSVLTFSPAEGDGYFDYVDLSSKTGNGLKLMCVDFRVARSDITLSGLQCNVQFYEAYQQGYDKGSSSGFNDGYNKGFKKGELNGYGKGYNDGASASEYTFLGLFSALLDAPIKAFTSLFSFDVFGQNLANFFLALLTFAVTIKIIALLL